MTSRPRKPGSAGPSMATTDAEGSAVSRASRDYESPGFSIEHKGGAITGPDQ